MSSFPLSAVTADVTSLGCQGCHDSSLKALSAVTADGSSSIRVNFYKFQGFRQGWVVKFTPIRRDGGRDHPRWSRWSWLSAKSTVRRDGGRKF